MSVRAASYPADDGAPQLTDAEIEAILLAELDPREDAPQAFEMAQAPEKGRRWARWLLVFMFGLVIIGGWVKP
jgi:hypothetical protein